MSLVTYPPFHRRFSNIRIPALEYIESGSAVTLDERPDEIHETFLRLLENAGQAATQEREYIWSVNSTAQQERPRALEDEFRTLFAAAREEIFEDGMETQFSRKLVAHVERYGVFAIELLAHLIIEEPVNAEVASEALRWIGRIENPYSHLARRRLLERCLLYSDSSRVRDGALLGLASMDDPASIPYLKQAIERESIRELRQDIGQVLEQLEDTQRGSEL